MSDTPQQAADSSGEDEAGIRDEGGDERSSAGCLGRVISGIAELPVRVPIFALAVHVCLYAFQA